LRLLLDTHALLWWWTDDPRLLEAARDAIANPENEIWVSAASAWEIATKERLGKLELLPNLTLRFNDLIEQSRFRLLAIDASHALLAGSLRQDHRDPFDRMLAAQAQIENLHLVTTDRAFEAFGTPIFW
jgi:PIN domain nuclease of toxin-antitoxin system